LGRRMSYSGLLELFTGRLNPQECVRVVLSLKSPQRMKKFLIKRHEILFPKGDRYKIRKWNSYPKIKGTSQIVPVTSKSLLDGDFMTKMANRLSFDISRFTEFLSAYNRVDEDIKPIMFHYALIYIFDFFSRTWLKYGRNQRHGLAIPSDTKRTPVADTEVKIHLNGIFPRAIDAFYIVGQSSLFSSDNKSGISYQRSLKGGTVSKRIQKLKYCDKPKVSISRLIDIYDSLNRIVGDVKISNQILVGYLIIFALSSICRYRPEQWFSIQEDRDLRSKLEILQSDYLHEWIPEILLQLRLERDVLDTHFKALSLEERFGFGA
jgi:hypothetical protein